MNQRRMILAIDIDPRRIRDDGIGLRRRLAFGIDLTFRSRHADEIGIHIVGWKGQKEMRIDGELRMFLVQEFERSLPDSFARPAGRR